MVKKITFNIDDEIYALLEEAAAQVPDGMGKDGARLLAKTVVENWVKYYQCYALGDSDIGRAAAYNKKMYVFRWTGLLSTSGDYRVPFAPMSPALS